MCINNKIQRILDGSFDFTLYGVCIETIHLHWIFNDIQMMAKVIDRLFFLFKNVFNAGRFSEKCWQIQLLTNDHLQDKPVKSVFLWVCVCVKEGGSNNFNKKKPIDTTGPYGCLCQLFHPWLSCTSNCYYCYKIANILRR